MKKNMRTHSVFLLIILGLAVMLAGCNAESAATGWHLSQTSAKQLFKAELSCTTPPAVGDFQQCQIQIRHADNRPVSHASVLIDGGMPAHGHGLPTAPEAVALDNDGNFRIDGLKYSMMGAWVLGFLVKTPEVEDKIVFDFVI